MRGRLLYLVLSAALAFGAPARALDPAGFTLETGSPDALCPELATTREVVARRLGALVVEGRRGWRARYTMAHAPSGSPRDFIRLELFNPEGGRELLRDLPIEGDSCRTMAEVIALVLDRHFRGLSGMDASDGPEEPRATPARAPAAVHQSRPKAKAPAPAPPTRPELSRVTVREAVERPIRLALRLADSVPDAQPSLGALAWFPVFRAVTLGAELSLDLTRREEQLVRGASARTSGVSAHAFVAWSAELGGSFIYGGPSISVSLERGAGSELAGRRDQLRAVWAGGITGGLAIALGRQLFFTWSSNLDVRIPGAAGAFVVQEREVLAPRPLLWSWGIGVGYAFSPRRREGPAPAGL